MAKNEKKIQDCSRSPKWPKLMRYNCSLNNSLGHPADGDNDNDHNNNCAGVSTTLNLISFFVKSIFLAAAGPEVKYALDQVWQLCYSSMITIIYSLHKPLNLDSVMKVEENVNPGGNGINNKGENNDK